jgi:hypothetical protein
MSLWPSVRMTEHGEFRFKIVKVETAGHEVLGRLSNLSKLRRKL